MSTAPSPLPASLSKTPRFTIGFAVATAAAFAASALLAGPPASRRPVYLSAPPAVALEGIPTGDGRSAVLFSADGKSRITITVEDVAAPAVSPARYQELAPEAEVRHASTRP